MIGYFSYGDVYFCWMRELELERLFVDWPRVLGCHATYHIFIGVLCCFCRDFCCPLAHVSVGLFGAYLESKLFSSFYKLSIHKCLDFAGWSSMTLQRLLRSYRCGCWGQMVPTILLSYFWPFYKRGSSLFPFFFNKILLNWFLILKNQLFFLGTSCGLHFIHFL